MFGKMNREFARGIAEFERIRSVGVLNLAEHLGLDHKILF
jgi:hypothetical protein